MGFVKCLETEKNHADIGRIQLTAYAEITRATCSTRDAVMSVFRSTNVHLAYAAVVDHMWVAGH